MNVRTSEAIVTEGDDVKEKKLFQTMFLKNDRSLNVKVLEVEEIDLAEILRHLNRGEDVFITSKSKHNFEEKRAVSREVTEPWYFTHI